MLIVEPTSFFLDYIHGVMEHATYRALPEEDAIYGEIPGFEDVTAKADTLEHCRHNLVEALEEWIFFRWSRQLPLPSLNDLVLPPQRPPSDHLWDDEL